MTSISGQSVLPSPDLEPRTPPNPPCPGEGLDTPTLKRLLKKRRPTLGKKVGIFKETAIEKGKIIGEKLAAKRRLRFSNSGGNLNRFKKRRSSLSAACHEVSKIAKAIRDAEPGVATSLFWGTTELVIQIKKSNSSAFFFGRNNSAPGTPRLSSAPPTPRQPIEPANYREPPLLSPTPPRVTVKGEASLQIGCLTEMFTDERLIEKVYTLRGHCDICKTLPNNSGTKKMVKHSQCFYTTSIADRVKRDKRPL